MQYSHYVLYQIHFNQTTMKQLFPFIVMVAIKKQTKSTKESQRIVNITKDVEKSVSSYITIQNVK